MKLTYVSIFVITLVLTSGIPLFSGPGVINTASARYAPANTQTQANDNDCDIGTNCAINSPQTQGDGTANSPTNLQISKSEADQLPQEPPTFPQPEKFTTGSCTFGGIVVTCDIVGSIYSTARCSIQSGPWDCTLTLRPPNTGNVQAKCTAEVFIVIAALNCIILPVPAEVLVIKKVICPQGFVCPTADKFLMKIEAGGGIVDPETFVGSETGTNVKIYPPPAGVRYQVTETFPPPVTGLNLFVNQDIGCLGEIRSQESRTCTITNEYRVSPIPP
jgi:hypothetical protein